MKISIILTSHREKSETSRIGNVIRKKIIALNKNINCFLFDFSKELPPLWSADKKNEIGFWGSKWKMFANHFQSSDGFILVVPEYGGMSSPNAKNFFLICDNGELAHKPGLIISISSGNGGAYPVSELRSSSYKNTHILWIPEHIIIRNVVHYKRENHEKYIPEWLDLRID